ncbi:hypothetical protein BD414DRAFT_495481 [Trametes punicea]|nr:hypothetical protein BD414DRAFT_495481 [Trametes punicea]
MTLPPAPKLPAEALHEVFAYPDPTRAPDELNRFSDARRLEFFGGKMSEAAYLDVVAGRSPTVGTVDLESMMDAFSALAERTARAHRWHERVLGYPSNVDEDSAQEARRLFFTYAGAVCVEYGYARLREWVVALLDVLM